MNYKLAKVGLLRMCKPIFKKNEKITIGSSVKLIFELIEKEKDVNAERLWVDVKEISEDGKHFKGTIDNDPLYVDLKDGDEIEFSIHNVHDIDNS